MLKLPSKNIRGEEGFASEAWPTSASDWENFRLVDVEESAGSHVPLTIIPITHTNVEFVARNASDLFRHTVQYSGCLRSPETRSRFHPLFVQLTTELLILWSDNRTFIHHIRSNSVVSHISSNKPRSYTVLYCML